MPPSPPFLDSRSKSTILASSFAATIALGLLFWVGDAVVSAAMQHRPLGESLLGPALHDLWPRVMFFIIAGVFAWLYARLGRLERGLRLFYEAVAEAPDGVQLTDMEGRILYSNAAVETIYGFPPSHYEGRHVDEMNADPAFASKTILPALRDRGCWAGELLVRHRDQHTFPIWLNSCLVRDGRGRPIALLGIIRDMTELKKAEEDLRSYAHKLESAHAFKDLFTDILRHDLLNPVSAISLNAQHGARKGGDEAAKRAFAAIQADVAKLTDMIRSASMYAKLEGPELLERKTVDLDVMLRSVVDGFSQQIAARRMRVEHVRDGGQVIVAYAVIEDAVANLISNAIKYSPEGGRIEVGLAGDAQHVRIYVKDWGPGVKEEDRAKLFTRFQRVEKGGVQGTGLGLAIVKRIAELHGGRAWVDENPEGGSIFQFELPRENPAASTAA